MLKVSVLMPTFERPEYIGHAVKSFKEQSYENKELIILDNCSLTDYSRQYECENIKVYRLDKNYDGHINHGIEFATGDIITLLHDDDMFSDTEALANRVNPFNKNDDIEVIFTSWITIDKNGAITSGVQDCGNVSLKRLLEKEYIYYTTMAWRKEISKKFDIVDDSLHVNYDTLFKIKCLFECNCMPVHEPTVYYRQHSRQESAIHGHDLTGREDMVKIKAELKSMFGKYYE